MRALKLRLLPLVLSATLLWVGPVRAQDGLSTLSAASTLPIASVMVAGSAAAGTAVVALPLALSVSGAVLLVKAVETSARGTVYLLERASDGARASVEVAARASGGASMAVGTSVTVTAVAAGVILSAAGEAMAFIPNAMGRALLHNERVAY